MANKKKATQSATEAPSEALEATETKSEAPCPHGKLKALKNKLEEAMTSRDFFDVRARVTEALELLKDA